MAAARVYSCLPKRFTGIVDRALEDELEHIALEEGPIPRKARQAVDDPAAVALLGPMRSSDVMYAMPICNLAGLAHLAPSATYVGLTRDEPGAEEGMPESLQPVSTKPTFFRVAVRDTLLAAAAVSHASAQGWWPLALVHDDSDYGLALAAQLVMTGLRPPEDPTDAAAVVYAGRAEGAPADGLAALDPLPVLAFEGAAVAGFADEIGLDRVQFVLPQHAEEGFSEFQALDFVPQVYAAARLLRDVLGHIDGPDRRDVLAALWSSGAFDPHGDSLDRRCGLWRDTGGGLFEPLGVVHPPARA